MISGNFSFTKKNSIEILILIVSLIFSYILFWKNFKISSNGNMLISTKLWSDFAASIPLIRSFSYGDNFPPEYPIFAGQPIRYHFVFFIIVGFLEKIGLRLDWALNSLSTLGFIFLTFLIYCLGIEVFKSKGIGILSIILFLFNGSLGFLEFFKKNPPSLNTPSNIINNTEFSSFGPYDEKIVSAFWSLNIYSNQRHLALSYAFFLFLVLAIFKLSKQPVKFTFRVALILGILSGLFPFVHLSVFTVSAVSLVLFFLIYPKIRLKILTTGIVALFLAVPQFLYMGKPQLKLEIFHPGYLVEPLTLLNFLKYWFLNLGLTTILAPIGFILANKDQKKLFIPFLTFFVIGNLLQFTPDMPTNHKFFNLFIIGSNFFTALLLIKLWNIKLAGKLFFIPITLLLTLTGIIDLFPIVNDGFIELRDIPNNKAAEFILENTPKDAVFLNSSYLYHPASLAGRKIFLGWPYFAWSAGYDTNKRSQIMAEIFSKNDKESFCDQLQKEKIDYIEIQEPSSLENITINYQFIEEKMMKIFFDQEQRISIYDVNISCRNLTEQR